MNKNSFVLQKKKLDDRQIDMVLHYEKYIFDVLPEATNVSYWNIRQTPFTIIGVTISPSDFDFATYLEAIDIPEYAYEFND